MALASVGLLGSAYRAAGKKRGQLDALTGLNQMMFQMVKMKKDREAEERDRAERDKKAKEDRDFEAKTWEERFSKQNKQERTELTESRAYESGQTVLKKSVTEDEIALHSEDIAKALDLLDNAAQADDLKQQISLMSQAARMAKGFPEAVLTKYPELKEINADIKELNKLRIQHSREDSQAERERIKEENKNKPKPMGAASQRLFNILGKKADAAAADGNDEDEMGYVSLQTAVEQGEAISKVVTEMNKIDEGAGEVNAQQSANDQETMRKMASGQGVPGVKSSANGENFLMGETASGFAIAPPTPVSLLPRNVRTKYGSRVLNEYWAGLARAKAEGQDINDDQVRANIYFEAEEIVGAKKRVGGKPVGKTQVDSLVGGDEEDGSEFDTGDDEEVTRAVQIARIVSGIESSAPPGSTPESLIDNVQKKRAYYQSKMESPQFQKYGITVEDIIDGIKANNTPPPEEAAPIGGASGAPASSLRSPFERASDY